MILTLLFIIMVLLGLILKKIGENMNMNMNMNTDIDVFGMVIASFNITFLFISLIIIIFSHATANKTIQQNKIEYEGLCKRYEVVKSEYEDVSKSDVIADITAWNMKVYSTKYWSENLWTSWFNPRTVADNLDYISLDEESEDKE